MKCPIGTEQSSELLLAYGAGRLDPETAARLTRHIRACPACQDLFEGQQAVWSALDDWGAPPVSDDFDRQLYLRIDQEAQRSWWMRLVAPLRPVVAHRGLPVTVAAGLVLAASVFVSRTPVPLVPADVRMEAVQADQVERTLEDMELLKELDLRASAQQSSAM